MQHRPVNGPSRGDGGYLEISRQPLQILAFLLPLILLYEIGSARYLSDAAHGLTQTIRARSILLGFFQDFGVAGQFLPGLAIATVLLVWQVLSGERWRISLWALPVMVAESLAWTIPLLVLLALLQQTSSSSAAAGVSGPLQALSWQARVVISIGAGLYEELLFRMIGIAALHLVLVDLAKMNNRLGGAIAVLLSAAAFSVYHDVTITNGHPDYFRALLLMCAGTYFGTVYLARGFGIVVALHALYDVFVLVVIKSGSN